MFADLIYTLKRFASLSPLQCLPNGQLIAEDSLETPGQLSDAFSAEYIKITIVMSILHFSTLFCYYRSAIFSVSIISTFDARHRFGSFTNTSLLAAEFDITVFGSKEITDATPETMLKMYTSEDYKDAIYIRLPCIPASMILCRTINTVHRRMGVFISFVIYTIVTIVLLVTPYKVIVIILLQICHVIINVLHVVLYIYTAEVYPVSIRASGSGISDAFWRLGSVIGPLVAQSLPVGTIDLVMFVFIVFAIVSAVLTWKYKFDVQ